MQVITGQGSGSPMEIWTLVPAFVVGANSAAIPRFRRAASAFVLIAARFDDGHSRDDRSNRVLTL